MLVRPFVTRLGEARTLVCGLIVGGIAVVGFSLVGAGWVVFALIPVAALGELAGPALTSLMSTRVADDAQGELQGVLASPTALAYITIPPVASRAFYHFTRADAPFVLGAVVIFVSIPLMWRSLFANS